MSTNKALKRTGSTRPLVSALQAQADESAE